MKHIFAFLIPCVLLIMSCKHSENPVGPSTEGGKITVGGVIDVTNQSIGTGGGTIKVSKPGDPLDGFEMTIRPNSFSQSTSFQLSYVPIVKHQLGEHFNPISPMIRITCNESFSSHPIKIKIPIKLPTNHFASGFFYNENTQTLETIPSIELTDSSITLTTQSLPSNKRLGKTTDDVQTNLIISSILESALDNGAVLSTGFEPGYDDWEFQNSGSYAEPEGQCAGQSMSMVYYFYEKRLKASEPLYHKFDVVNDKSTHPAKLWQDNPRGYRLAAVMQREVTAGWGNIGPELSEHFSNPTLVWKLFIHGIKVTGAPQIIGVQSYSFGYAHAMVVYKVNLTERKLYIADPNFPTSVRTIAYQNGVLGPYNTKTKHGEPEMIFDQLGFMGVSAMVRWSKLTEKYNQFEAGTIGNDIFPSYKLYVESTSGVELTEGMTVTNPVFKIVCKSDKCESFIGGTDKLQPFETFNKDGDPLDKGDDLNHGVATVYLNQGANKIGIYIKGMKSDGREYYLDFKWITVNSNQSTQPTLVITPNPLNGLKDKKYKFTATLKGANLPAKTEYRWGMDAHGTMKWVYNDSTLVYKYTETGNFPIQVTLSDSVTGTTVASGTAEAHIREAANNYEYLITSWLLNFSLYADMTFDPANAVAGEAIISTEYFYRGNRDLNWDGNRFSVDYEYRIPPISVTGDTMLVSGRFSGEISNDGQMLISFDATEHRGTENGYLRHQYITIANTPINNCSPTGCSAVHEGSQVANYVQHIGISGSYKDSQTGTTVNYSLVSIDYNSSSKPKLGIAFIR